MTNHIDADKLRSIVKARYEQLEYELFDGHFSSRDREYLIRKRDTLALLLVILEELEK